tara:strand:- start:96 stop:254 length:159 start_codon:yes stop_codon:yes gene_type:complete
MLEVDQLKDLMDLPTQLVVEEVVELLEQELQEQLGVHQLLWVEMVELLQAHK